jgi:hypothetical protein
MFFRASRDFEKPWLNMSCSGRAPRVCRCRKCSDANGPYHEPSSFTFADEAQALCTCGCSTLRLRSEQFEDARDNRRTRDQAWRYDRQMELFQDAFGAVFIKASRNLTLR